VNNQELEPSVEVAHLRRLLDIQPACLMRLGADGKVLAANDAALMLMGVASGVQALGQEFADWVDPDQRDRWRTFTRGVVEGSPASIECDVTAPSGEPHPTLFHGVPLLDHPDGVASLAVAARAVAGQRQLEAAIGELEEQLRERDAEQVQARERLAEVEAGRRQLAETVAALEARLKEREAGPGNEAQLRQVTADLEARDAELAVADAARRTAEANCARALEDVRQLEVAMEAFASRQKQMIAERAAERQREQQMIESMAASREQELTAARDRQEWDRLTTRVEEGEAALRALEAERETAQARLDEERRGRLRLEGALQEAQQALAGLDERERDARVQRDALQARLDEVLHTGQEREALLSELETAHRELAAAHALAKGEHDRLISALRDHAVHLDALANGAPAAGHEERQP
jgi:chromosome segregation ATPase